MQFEFSDTIAGYVTRFDSKSRVFGIRTTDDRVFSVKLTSSTFARFTRNLGADYADCTGRMDELLVAGQYLFVYGIFYPESGDHQYEAKSLDFLGRAPGEYCFEAPDWWARQAASIADFFIQAQFGRPQGIDYRQYRTLLKLTGEKAGSNRQEIDTISRLVYGFASTYLLTGEERFLEAAEKGTAYMQEHGKFEVDAETICWYHCLDVVDGGVYFNVLANGLPYLLGTERFKGSHSMSGYHSLELAYLAAVYTNLLHTQQPLDLHFKPAVNGFQGRVLRVQPDILPPGSVCLSAVWIDGKPWKDFDAEQFTIELPALTRRPTVKVCLVPVVS